MKVSAPVVPTPDPPAPAPSVSVDPAGTEAAAPIADPPAMAMAQWPEWHRPVDIALCILVAVLAFLTASYTARNTDIWRHMGTGRLLLQGNHPIGGDPLSFTGADAHRAWVNSNWLFDAVFYLAYSADDSGTTSVVIKALAFAAAFAVLFLLRNPNQSLWPWAVMAALGAIATGSQASLRPQVFGMLFLSIVLATIYRGNWAGSKWRMPAILGGVCWMWACTESMFLLGPITVALVLLGEYIHVKMTAGQPVPEEGEDPFWTAPTRAALVRGLLAAVIGVLLNPMFLGALVRSPLDALGQLIPFEMTFGWEGLFAGDDSLAGLALSPTNSLYNDKAERGDNIPGYCVIALTVIAGLLLAVGYVHLRATHVLLWFGFVLLALLHYRAIPVAAVVIIPLAAGHLNGLSRMFRLRGASDPTTKLALNLSGIGRILTVTVFLALIGATVPGYLHVPVSETALAYNRRVSWGIEEEEGLSRSAKLIEKWRVEGSLSPKSRALLTHYDFGDYCAWFAPSERVFINSRFRFHTPELVELAALRAELRKKPKDEDDSVPGASGVLKAMADRYAADLYILGQWNQRLGGVGINKVEAEFTADKLQFVPPRLKLHIDGRVAIICRQDTESGRFTLGNLRYMPERDAFGPTPAAVPSVSSIAPLAPVDGWIAEYLARIELKVTSVSTDDSMLFQDLNAQAGRLALLRWNARQKLSGIGYLMGDAVFQFAANPGPRSPDDEEMAYPVMAHRAARRAIVETPDDPEPYYVLGMAYTSRAFGNLDPKEAGIQRCTSIRRFLDRVPVAPNGPARFARLSISEGLNLFLVHFDSGHWDLALDALTNANAKIKVAAEADLPPAQFLRYVRDYYRQKMAEFELGETLQALARERRPAPSREVQQQMLQNKYESVLDPDLDKGETPEKMKPKDGAWVKSRTQGLEDRVKRRVSLMIEGANQSTSAGGIAQKFVESADRGLTARAIEMVLSDTDWKTAAPKAMTLRVSRNNLEGMRQRFGFLIASAQIQDMGDGSALVRTNPIGLFLQAIALQFQSGGLDRAAQQLKNVSGELDELETANADEANAERKLEFAQSLPRYRAGVKALRTTQARLEGNYEKLAEESREQIGAIPKFTGPRLEELKISLDGIYLARGSFLGGTAPPIDPFAGTRAALSREAQLHFDCGMAALMTGDNREARTRFAMALKPQGVSVGDLNFAPDDPLVAFASRYLALLEKFADPPKR